MSGHGWARRKDTESISIKLNKMLKYIYKLHTPPPRHKSRDKYIQLVTGCPRNGSTQVRVKVNLLCTKGSAVTLPKFESNTNRPPDKTRGGRYTNTKGAPKDEVNAATDKRIKKGEALMYQRTTSRPINAYRFSQFPTAHFAYSQLLCQTCTFNTVYFYEGHSNVWMCAH